MSMEMIWAVSISPEGVIIWLLPVILAITLAIPFTRRSVSAVFAAEVSVEMTASAIPYSDR